MTASAPTVGILRDGVGVPGGAVNNLAYSSRAHVPDDTAAGDGDPDDRQTAALSRAPAKFCARTIPIVDGELYSSTDGLAPFTKRTHFIQTRLFKRPHGDSNTCPNVFVQDRLNLDISWTIADLERVLEGRGKASVFVGETLAFVPETSAFWLWSLQLRHNGHELCPALNQPLIQRSWNGWLHGKGRIAGPWTTSVNEPRQMGHLEHNEAQRYAEHIYNHSLTHSGRRRASLAAAGWTP